MEDLPHGMYRVELANGHRVLAHFTGAARRNPVRFMVGDKIMLEMSPFDLSKGRIIGKKN